MFKLIISAIIYGQQKIKCITWYDILPFANGLQSIPTRLEMNVGPLNVGKLIGECNL